MGNRAAAIRVWALPAVVGIGVGYAIATLPADDSPERAPASPSVAPVSVPTDPSLSGETSAGEFIALRRELEAERRARASLALELESLREQVSHASSEAPEDEEKSADLAQQTAGTKAKPEREQPWFDRAALEEVDYSSSEIAEIESRFEELEMQKLYLEDQSRRDGTFRSAGYNGKMLNLVRDLRNDLGTEGYDAYLYATGKNNRVEVREVLADSPAAYAGLEAGDIVVSYSGLRVFNPREFKRATTAGEPGSRVILEVQRDGELYRLSVVRGPLGIRMGHLKSPPLSHW